LKNLFFWICVCLWSVQAEMLFDFLGFSLSWLRGQRCSVPRSTFYCRSSAGTMPRWPRTAMAEQLGDPSGPQSRVDAQPSGPHSRVDIQPLEPSSPLPRANQEPSSPNPLVSSSTQQSWPTPSADSVNTQFHWQDVDHFEPDPDHAQGLQPLPDLPDSRPQTLPDPPDSRPHKPYGPQTLQTLDPADPTDPTDPRPSKPQTQKLRPRPDPDPQTQTRPYAQGL
jgi:hypothetical protein